MAVQKVMETSLAGHKHHLAYDSRHNDDDKLYCNRRHDGSDDELDGQFTVTI